MSNSMVSRGGCRSRNDHPGAGESPPRPRVIRGAAGGCPARPGSSWRQRPVMLSGPTCTSTFSSPAPMVLTATRAVTTKISRAVFAQVDRMRSARLVSGFCRPSLRECSSSFDGGTGSLRGRMVKSVLPVERRPDRVNVASGDRSDRDTRAGQQDDRDGPLLAEGTVRRTDQPCNPVRLRTYLADRHVADGKACTSRPPERVPR